MAAFFGDLERLIADLYPYRWPITAGVLIVLAALAAFGYRRGWHMVIWRKRLPVAIVGAPMLVLAVIAGWYLASPLFIDKRVDEEFPFALNAIIPEDMDRSDVEKVMEGISHIDQEDVDEEMPVLVSLKKTLAVSNAAAEEAAARAAAEQAAAAKTAAEEAAAKAVAEQAGAAKAAAEEAVAKAAAGDVAAAKAAAEEAAARAAAEEAAAARAAAEEAFARAAAEEAAAARAAAEDVAKAAAEEAAAQPAEPVKLKSGSFRDADNFHRGSGQATICRGPDGSHLLRLENLDVTNGPDLRVILTPHENPTGRDDVKEPGYVELGKLKGNQGNQNYPIPDDVDVSSQSSVVIYCKPFHVIFSVAVLQAEG